MTIRFKYNKPGEYRRYVKFCPVYQTYSFCHQSVDKPQFDLAQGTCDESDIPSEIAQAARERAGTWPSYVSWP